MRLVVVLLCVVALSSLCEAERKRYDGYQQWFVTPKTREQLDVLRSMDDEVMFFDGEARRVGERVELLVPPAAARRFRRLVHDMDLEVRSTNIQRFLDQEFARLDAKHKAGFLAYDPDDYNTLDDINAELERLEQEECPTDFRCAVSSIGYTYEGREINMLSISSGSAQRSVWLDSLIHAREWLAGTTVMRLADYLLTAYGSDDDATYLLDNYNFYIVPVMNPDGYDYTWTNDRFWRKSRNRNDGSSCIGTDLNRNYPVYWDAGSGSSGNACSDVYHGSEPASEPETQAVIDETLALNEDGSLLVWISYHTAAEFFLLPYGGTDDFTCNYPPSDIYGDQLQAAEAAVERMEDVGGLNWRADNACDGIYDAAGITMDFAFDPTDGADVKYSYTPELRGPGFNPPASFIQVSFEENWAGFVALMSEIEAIDRRN